MTDTLRTETFPSGIVGAGLGQIERQIPSDEPPPLPVNSALQVIGKNVDRRDGRAKVTGAVRFTVDVKLPGLLHARIPRSSLPHARVRSIETAAAARQPGVRAVLVMAPRDAVLRYAGEPVAAVAATTQAAAEAALRLIQVDYAPLPFVVDLDTARGQGAPPVYLAGRTALAVGRRGASRFGTADHRQYPRAGYPGQPRQRRARFRAGRIRR